MDFKRITLTLTGTAAWTREYEVKKTLMGMEASLYEGGWVYNKMESRASCRKGHGSWGKSEYKSFSEKLDKLGVKSWDGFSKSNPNVLDGDSFSLEIELADGKMMYAHGNNSYPKNYHEFEAMLDEAVYGPKEY